jgi:hypothetical protein
VHVPPNGISTPMVFATAPIDKLKEPHGKFSSRLSRIRRLSYPVWRHNDRCASIDWNQIRNLSMI